MTPGPPLRGTLSPPATSTTKICRSTRPLLNVAVRLSPPLSTSTRSSGPSARLEVLDGVEVGGDVVADRGVRAAAGLHRADPLGRQHAVAQQEVGVLGGVDVVGHDGQPQLAGERPAQRRDQRGLAGADRPADADPQRPRPGAQRRVRVDARVGMGVRHLVGMPWSSVGCSVRMQRDAPPRWRGARRRCRAAGRRAAGRSSTGSSVRPRGVGRDPVALGGEPGEQACTAYGSRPSSRTAALAGPVTAPYAATSGGVAGGQPGRGRRPRRARPGGAAPRAPASVDAGAGHIARPARSSARPCAAGRPPQRRRRRPGVQRRASQRRSRSRGRRGRARRPRRTPPRPARRWPAGRAGTPSSAGEVARPGRRRPPPPGRRSGRAPPAGSRPSASSSSSARRASSEQEVALGHRQLGRPGRARPPRRRCAP